MENVRVLIVDDEPGMRLGAARVLKKVTGEMPELELQIAFQCETAETGAEAIEKLEQNRFDLMLLDYKLPDISGLEVLDRIRTKKIDVVTIMMTAYASLEVAVSATKNGTFDFLAKPFSPEELESVVIKAASSLLATRHAQKLSAEKRRVRFEFISVLAHELKSPLSAVESYLELLKSHTAGEQLSDYDTVVERSLARLKGMRRLIFDLLDLTRIESGEKARNISEFDVVETIKAGIETVKDVARQRGISIHLEAPDTLLFFGDVNELGIVSGNLLSNAVKYNRDGGRVDVTVSMKGDVLTLRVQDTGIGIDKADQARLFKAFSRIRTKDTERIEGSGLGLSILKRLVGLYNGTINIESTPGVGSTFTATLKSTPP